MIIEGAVATFLRAQSPDEFCHPCVSRRLEVSFEDAAAALKRLCALPGFALEPGRCVTCGRLRLVALFRHSSATVTPESKIPASIDSVALPLSSIRPFRPLRCAVCGAEIAETEATVTVPDDRVAHQRCIGEIHSRHDTMPSQRQVSPQRLIIVRMGAGDVYDKLQRTFGGKRGTRIMYDRRAMDDGKRRPVDRRFPQDPTILRSRGFFVTRPRRIRSSTSR